MTSVERYIALRRKLGYGLLQTDRLLKAYAQFAKCQGDTHVRVSTAVAWATAASTPGTRYVRLNAVVLLARFLHAEDAGHEVPPSHLFPPPQGRLMPYIYSADELSRIVAAAAKLPRTYALRRATYATLFGLIASTGLRISEALNIRLSDVQPDGVLLIRRGKGGKSRLIPLHPTAATALNSYLDSRLLVPAADDHLFLSAGMRAISRSMAELHLSSRWPFTLESPKRERGRAEFTIFGTRLLLDLWKSVRRDVKMLLLISWHWRRTLGMWTSRIPIGISRRPQN